MSDSLKNTTIRNIGYTSITKVIQIVTSAIANIILTRTLLPNDYGIVGFAVIFISFLAQFGDLGIGSAIIQKKDLNDDELYTAFTIKILLSLVLFLFAFIFAPLTIRFFDNQAIVPVIRVLAFTFVLNTFSFLPNVLLTRDLNYKKISCANIVSAIINSSVAVVLALTGFKYWSLVIAGICMTLSLSVLVNIFRPVRYRFAYNSDAARNFLKYGGNLFLAGFSVFLIFNADNFIIGSVKGATNLGYYSVAFTWGTMVCSMIGSMVLNVLFPTFSKIQGNRDRLKRAYLRILQYVSFGGLLINMTLFVASRDFLLIVLGHNTDKWMPALSALRILCFYGIARLLLEPVGSVMMALGRTDILKKANFLAAAIELGGLYPVLYFYGIEGVAVLVTCAYISQYLLYYLTLRGELQIGFKELCTCVNPALMAVVPLVILFFAGEAKHSDSIPIFIVKLIGCTCMYLITYGLITKWSLYKDMRRQLLNLDIR
ncbi:lipopolysaccharide biosynthesis protein [Syntrophus aciditrophicus]|uniref:Oligosaccharide translocase (Flippase) n=1 Tax=Syntrophus aciditrophicus (strain SB) TaxID=56780 RepID=Q2LPU8_SYNAS|nr:lipopolysaccharide biosynthesis protein [Syntrophus aciditrophicus]ABC76298.1 oligosaccharide translocase (flippase) [Syntrophus aciditrophicus SB]